MVEWTRNPYHFHLYIFFFEKIFMIVGDQSLKISMYYPLIEVILERTWPINPGHWTHSHVCCLNSPHSQTLSSQNESLSPRPNSCLSKSVGFWLLRVISGWFPFRILVVAMTKQSHLSLFDCLFHLQCCLGVCSFIPISVSNCLSTVKTFFGVVGLCRCL